MRATAAYHSVSSLTVSQTIGRRSLISADDYEMSLDGITTLPEWMEPFDTDPLEDRCGQHLRRHSSRS